MNQNSVSDEPSAGRVTLNEAEQDRLIRAIETAIEVKRQEQFHEWVRGPFRELLPHEFVVCAELRMDGGTRSVACLHHNLPDTAAMDRLFNAERGLVYRLAIFHRMDSGQSFALAANALDVLLSTEGGRPENAHLYNLVVQRITLLSGVAYTFFLGNVPEDQLDRCQQLFKLVASHLKMALSRALPKRDHQAAAALTPRELEILQWMSQGKSNREISSILDISAITLKHHVNKLYRKLDVQSRAEAVSRGLAAPDPYAGDDH